MVPLLGFPRECYHVSCSFLFSFPSYRVWDFVSFYLWGLGFQCVSGVCLLHSLLPLISFDLKPGRYQQCGFGVKRFSIIFSVRELILLGVICHDFLVFSRVFYVYCLFLSIGHSELGKSLWSRVSCWFISGIQFVMTPWFSSGAFLCFLVDFLRRPIVFEILLFLWWVFSVSGTYLLHSLVSLRYRWCGFSV